LFFLWCLKWLNCSYCQIAGLHLQQIWLPIKFLNRIQINIVNILVDLQPIWLPIKFLNILWTFWLICNQFDYRLSFWIESKLILWTFWLICNQFDYRLSFRMCSRIRIWLSIKFPNMFNILVDLQPIWLSIKFPNMFNMLVDSLNNCDICALLLIQQACLYVNLDVRKRQHHITGYGTV